MALTVEERISKARIGLLLAHPFYGSLICQLTMVCADDNPQIKTMATDGRVIYYNTDFTMSLSHEELMGVLAHEVCHPALGHLWRVGHRDPQKWNVATDLVINEALGKDGLQLPKGTLHYNAPEFKHLDPSNSSEANYEKLPPNPKQQSWGEHVMWGAGDGNGDGDDDGDSAFGKAGLEDQWKQKTAAAANLAKQQGKMPAGLDRALEDLLHPTLPWQDLLMRYCTMDKDDYTFVPPDRRFAAEDIYLPDLGEDPALHDVVVAIDTSGSIGQQELNEFLSEVDGILRSFSNVKGVLMMCDAQVAYVGDINKRPDRGYGGGGTSFIPVFEEIRKRNITPACVIYLTDMYGSFPERVPNYPVIWAATSDIEAPFGVTVKVRR